ncbi:hypothetical protein [Methylobacter sp. YRD-M1]|uniref:hypothetical protein n=1 Tax=Methylobacter sp. YRD-M1 TaxID=2911520 RepID=UPI00227AA824|nr:hypothetical protein [Methylobacter sp. YRD-M1]WAK02881.1 hypothetical protein LZ558_03595 [Methylobacter sp. YRD-M1]
MAHYDAFGLYNGIAAKDELANFAAKPLKYQPPVLMLKKPPLLLPKGGFSSRSAGCATGYFQTCYTF